MSNHHSRLKTHSKTTLLNAALAGTIATVPMSLFMLVTQRFLPRGQRYALPPEVIMEEVSQRSHARLHWNKSLLVGSSLLSHFGYGATMGALYTPLERTSFLPAPVRGTLFGLGVWASSYLGALPLLRFRAAGHREPGHRNLMMIFAHIVWGSVMGATAEALAHKHA